MFEYLFILLLFVGPCLGSFASAIAFRAPRRESWIFASADDGAAPIPGARRGARSRCPSCGVQLGFFDLIPILSWVCLRGRCRKCRQPISGLYPFLELLALLLSLGLLGVYGVGLSLFALLTALPFLLALLVISAQGKHLPDHILTILFCLVLVLVLGEAWRSSEPLADTLDHASGVFAYGAFAVLLAALRVKVYRLRVEATGEVALLAIAGLWFGTMQMPLYLIVAGFYGMAWAGLRSLARLPRQPTMTHAFVAALLILALAGDRLHPLLLSLG